MSELSKERWQTAHIMARLLSGKMDVNELKKATAYLRTCVDIPNGGARFFTYLQNLVRNGNKIGHSQRTEEYYRSLDEACVKCLKPLQDTPQAMLDILGWVGRLIPYYNEAPLAELLDEPMEVTVVSDRQAAIAQAVKVMNWTLESIVEAEVMKIEGNKVTYSLPGEIKLTQKEPKRFGDLAVGSVVRVEVVELRETGVPKKVKLVD